MEKAYLEAFMKLSITKVFSMLLTLVLLASVVTGVSTSVDAATYRTGINGAFPHTKAEFIIQTTSALPLRVMALRTFWLLLFLKPAMKRVTLPAL